MRSERWWVEKVPPDPQKPQPLAHTGDLSVSSHGGWINFWFDVSKVFWWPNFTAGTINPLTCYDTLEKEVIPCFSFIDVKCKPWTSTACECDDTPETQGSSWVLDFWTHWYRSQASLCWSFLPGKGFSQRTAVKVSFLSSSPHFHLPNFIFPFSLYYFPVCSLLLSFSFTLSSGVVDVVELRCFSCSVGGSKFDPFTPKSNIARRPICVTDIAKRSSPASPANKRSSTEIQHVSCRKTFTRERPSWWELPRSS